MSVPILETARLILRGLVLEDHKAIQKHFPHWEIVKYLSRIVPWPYPENGAYQWLKESILPKIEKGEAWGWGIIPKGGADEVVGVITLHLHEQAHGHRGFWLAQEFQGQGFMTEAVTAVNEYVFEKLKWEKIIIKNAVENEASHRVKEKTGAKFLRIEPSDYIGGFTQTEVWQVTRQGWLEFKNKL